MTPRPHAGVEQLALGVELRAGFRLDNFLTAPGHPVIAVLDGLRGVDGERRVYLQGPIACGKSHLLQAMCNAADGLRSIYLPLAERARFSADVVAGISGLDLICIDDVDHVAGDARWERALFNLFNDADAAGARLLMAARRSPSVLALPDLGSRLHSMLRLSLPAPDDALKSEVLKTRAREYGFSLFDDAVQYLLARGQRDLHSLMAVLEGVDRFALSTQRKVNRTLIGDYLRSTTRAEPAP